MTPDKADIICPSNIFFGFAKGLSCTAITKTIDAPNGGISQIMPSNELSRKANKLIKINAPSALNNALIKTALFINLLSMIKLYLTTLFYFLIIDTIGIQTFVIRIYNKNLPDNLKINLDIASAVIFYLIFVFGLVYFVVAPYKNASLFNIIIPAAMYGLVTYATYALTVKAVFNVFNWTIVISDIAWGMTLCTTICVLTLYSIQKISFLN